MQPNYGIIGDNTGVDLPQMPADDSAEKELRQKAKYSRSKEYKELRQKAQTRIEFYQKFLPDGRLIGTTPPADLQRKWELANLLIAEIEQLFGETDQAEAILREQFDVPSP